jgi:peroxiredoxin
VFLGVDVRDPLPADAHSFVDQYGVPYPSVYDPYSDVAYKFSVVPFPVTYVLDAQSRVAAVISSLPDSQKDLDDTIRQVLS